MAREIVEEMYGFEPDITDNENMIPSVNTSNILTPRGVMKLLNINGVQYEIVNPGVVVEMQKLISFMQQKLNLLEADLQQTKSKLERTRKQLNETNKQLTNKVDYE